MRFYEMIARIEVGRRKRGDVVFSLWCRLRDTWKETGSIKGTVLRAEALLFLHRARWSVYWLFFMQEGIFISTWGWLVGCWCWKCSTALRRKFVKLCRLVVEVGREEKEGLQICVFDIYVCISGCEINCNYLMQLMFEYILISSILDLNVLK